MNDQYIIMYYMVVFVPSKIDNLRQIRKTRLLISREGI